MQITTQEVGLETDGRPMRTVVCAPRAAGPWPGILLVSEIFQLTAPIRRSMERLAGHGFLVAAPEIFHRVEPPGTVLSYDDAGRMRGLDDARRTSVAEYDRDRSAVLDHLQSDARVRAGALGAIGFCIGGHLALRAALDPRVRATVACYPTGVHDGRLGSDADAGTLRELGQIQGALRVVFGSSDPHTPPHARAVLANELSRSNRRHTVLEFDAEHAFMRDEGPRYDSEAADRAWSAAIALFHEQLSA